LRSMSVAPAQSADASNPRRPSQQPQIDRTSHICASLRVYSIAKDEIHIPIRRKPCRGGRTSSARMGNVMCHARPARTRGALEGAESRLLRAANVAAVPMTVFRRNLR
jgi:hypothetical protein